MAYLRGLKTEFLYALALVLVCLCAPARAVSSDPTTYSTIQLAWEACQREAAVNFNKGYSSSYTGAKCYDGATAYGYVYGPNQIVGCLETSADQCYYSRIFGYEAGGGCASGTTFNTTTGSCQDPNAEALCAAKPSFSGTATTATSIASSNAFCKDGCSYYMAGGIEVSSSGSFTNTGTFYPYPSGQLCTVGNATSGPVGAESCIPSGSLSQCYNASTGQTCAITPRGNKACWTPAETGTKVSQDQKEALSKTVAPTVPAAPPTMVNAETQSSSSTTATAPSSSTTVTNNITYANVTGEAGTATTGSTSGGTATGTEPGTSTGTGGTDPDADNTSTGGADCTSAPVSGGDALKAQIAFQAWKTRCAIEAHGTDTSGNLDARGDDGMPVSGEVAGHGTVTEYGADGFDESGLGASTTCPVIPPMTILGQSVTIDTTLFCTWMEAVGALVLVFASIGCLRIIGST